MPAFSAFYIKSLAYSLFLSLDELDVLGGLPADLFCTAFEDIYLASRSSAPGGKFWEDLSKMFW